MSRICSGLVDSIDSALALSLVCHPQWEPKRDRRTHAVCRQHSAIASVPPRWCGETQRVVAVLVVGSRRHFGRWFRGLTWRRTWKTRALPAAVTGSGSTDRRFHREAIAYRRTLRIRTFAKPAGLSSPVKPPILDSHIDTRHRSVGDGFHGTGIGPCAVPIASQHPACAQRGVPLLRNPREGLGMRARFFWPHARY